MREILYGACSHLKHASVFSINSFQKRFLAEKVNPRKYRWWRRKARRMEADYTRKETAVVVVDDVGVVDCDGG